MVYNYLRNDINLRIVNNKYTIINPNTLSLQLQFIGLIGTNQYLLNKFNESICNWFYSIINAYYNQYYYYMDMYIILPININDNPSINNKENILYTVYCI